VHTENELNDAIQHALKYDHEVLIEEFTVGILDDVALAVGEIILSRKLFDYSK